MRGVASGVYGEDRVRKRSGNVVVFGDGGRRGVEQGFELGFELAAQRFVHIFEAEGLQTSARSPHGKEHLDLIAHGSAPHMKEQFNADTFGKGLLEME